MDEAGDPAPQLSVIVAAWNAAATIADAVASVLAETDVQLECIVVDDASTDDTAAIVEQLRARDDRIVLERLAENGGVSVARNRGLAVARGEWLAFLDADDRLVPGGLAAMVRAAVRHDALAVVGQRISTDGERTWYPVLYDQPDIREPGVKSLARNPGLLYFAGPAGKVIHRSCAAGLSFEGRMLGDQPWILRALLCAGDRIVVVDDVVYEWRRPHPDRYVPTITAARGRSARLGTEAVTMAGRAFDIVAAEIQRVVDEPARQRLVVTYLERLVRADLAAQLHGAIRRSDPDLDAMLRALADLLAGVPADVVVGARDAIAVELLRPPLHGWHLLPPSARTAYWDLAAAAIRIDPAFMGAGRRWLARPALWVLTGPPRTAGRRLAGMVMRVLWFAAAIRRRARRFRRRP